jgi:exonuclease SbcC
MKLEKLRLRNFTSYSDCTIDFSKVALCSVIGPNGSGKSSIVESIMWTLFGHAKVGNKDLIRSGQTSVQVDLTFQLDGHRYEVSRSFEKSMDVDVKVDGAPIAQGNRNQTEELLRRLGIARELLLHSVVVSQGQLSSFVAAAPAARRDLVYAMLNLGRFDRANTVAKESLDTLRAAVSVHDRNVVALKEQLAGFPPTAEMLAQIQAEKAEVDRLATEVESLAVRQGQLATQDQAARVRAADLAIQVQQLQTQRATTTDRFKRLIDEAETSVRTIDTEVSLLPAHAQAIASLEAEIARSESVLDQIKLVQSQRATLESDIKEQRERYTFAVTRAQDTCPLCSSAIGTERFGQILAKMKTEMEEKVSLSSTLIVPTTPRRPDVMRGEVDNVKRRVSQAELRQQQRGEILERLTKMRAERDQAISEFDAHVAQAQAELTQAQAQLNAEVGVLGGQVAATRERHRQAAHSLEQAVGRRTTWETLSRSLEDAVLQHENNRIRLPEAEFVAAATSSVGVPLMISEHYLPIIEVRAQDLLSRMSDGRLTMQLKVTDKRTGVDLLAGSDQLRPVQSLSGGEQTRVALAIRLALSQVLSEMVGVKFDLVIVDEPEFLDAEGVSQFIQSLHRLADQFPQIFVVSHIPELQQAFPNAVVVRKSDGVSMAEVH